MNIQNSHFVITGAASGIGEAVARRLHSLGARVTLADINTERGEQVAASMGESVIRMT